MNTSRVLDMIRAVAIALVACCASAQGSSTQRIEMNYAAVNGLKMYYEIHGEGPPLLLLHGGAGSISAEWISYFSTQFRVVAMEQMGHGRTADVLSRGFHYHDMAEDTIALMRHLAIESAVVVGYSDGGIIGLDMAIHHPGRVAKLVIIGASSRLDGYTPAALAEGLSVTPETWPAPQDYARLSPDGKDHWPVFLPRLQRMWAAEPNFSLDAMASIQSPTLVIVGDRDIITLEHAVEMYRTIPHAQLCVVPNAVHGVMPRDTVLTFLKDAAGGRR